MKLTVEGIENEKGKYEQYKEVIKKQKFLSKLII